MSQGYHIALRLPMEEHAVEIVEKDKQQKGTLQNITKYVTIDKKLSKITKIEIKHIL